MSSKLSNIRLSIMIIILIHVLRLLGLCMCIISDKAAAPQPPLIVYSLPAPSSALPPPSSPLSPPPLCSPLIAPTPPAQLIASPSPLRAIQSSCSPSIAPTPPARSIAPPPPSIAPPLSCSPSITSTPPPLSNAPPARSIAPPSPYSPLITPPPTRSIAPLPSSNAPPPSSSALPSPCSPLITPTPQPRSITPPSPSTTPPPQSIRPPPPSTTPPSQSITPLPQSIAPPSLSITPPPYSPLIAPTPPRQSIVPSPQSIGLPPPSIAPPSPSIVPLPPSIRPPPPSPPPSNAPLAPSIALPPLIPSLIAPSPTAPSIVLSPSFPSLLQRLQSLPQPLIPSHTSDEWRALDMRAMVLLSLLSQIALFVLGKRRKHSVSLVNKLILWLAYQGKDLISIAALGKLSNWGGSIDALGKLSNPKVEWVNMIALHTKSNTPTGFVPKPSNIFASLWTPLLTLNLGGPDTITAYSFQDIQLWSRHLLTFVFQCFLAFCVIIWSVVQSFLSVFSIPLYFVGICKHIETILCLKAANSLKSKQFVFRNPGLQSHPLIENQESKKVLLGYILFAAMRPEVIIKEYPLSFKARMKTYLENRNQDRLILRGLLESDEPRSSNHLTHFDIAVVELGFIFDVVYTKAPLIYTWKGCILRLISLTLCIGTLFFFIFQLSFGRLKLNKIEPHDVFLTISLLVETIALDICAVLSNLCSDWAVVLMYDNCSAPKILQYVLQYFPCFLRRKKRSASMGQFDLLDYCWNSRMVGVYRFLQKHCSGDTLENCLRSKHTKFVEVPSRLKPKEVFQSRLDSFVSSDSFKATRGERTLVELGETDLEYSIKIHFEASIIVWHLATSICYHQDFENTNNASNEAMKISKYLSDYMMYLLVMRPAMLLPDDCSSLDYALDELTVLISEASNKDAAVDSLLEDLPEISAETAMDNLPKSAGYLATKLNRNRYKWELIKAMWIEMLLYAAHSNPYLNHVRQLGEYGREFISIIWVLGSYRVIQEVIEEACRKEYSL